MGSVHQENNLSSLYFLCELGKVEEGGLGKLFDGEVSDAHKESARLLIEKAGEGPKAARTIQAHPRIDIEELVHTSLYLHNSLQVNSVF